MGFMPKFVILSWTKNLESKLKANGLYRIPDPNDKLKTQPEQPPVNNALSNINFADEQENFKLLLMRAQNMRNYKEE
jgi:hypothetical protein